MFTCYHCSKPIKGKVTHYVAPMVSIQLGTDTCKTFHPKCYIKAEDQAHAEFAPLRGNAFNALPAKSLSNA